MLLTAPEANGFELALRSDALWMRMDSGAARNTVETQADASRVRLILESSRAFEVGSLGEVFTPNFELGLRHDGGDAETGTGVEVGAGLRYANPAWGLSVAASARVLVAHEDSRYEEWGASGSVRFDPGASGRGLSLTLSPTYGAAASGVESLWSRHDTAGLAANQGFQAGSRLETELGYGFGVFGGQGVATPYAGLGLWDGGRTWRMGTRWNLGSSFALGLAGVRREVANFDAPDHGLMLRGATRW